MFFTELLKQFSQEIDPGTYYTDKMKLWIQAYAPDKRSLVEFKNEMLMGHYNAELKKTCLFFKPKELRHENEIKTVLDHQLVNLRKYNMEPVPKCSYYL